MMKQHANLVATAVFSWRRPVAGVVLAALLLPVGAGARSPASSRLPPTADAQLARDIFKTLVEINTTHSSGTSTAAHAIETWLKSAGFAAEDVTFIAPPEHPNSGSVVVRLRAKHASAAPAAVLFLGHLDVVEAKREDWSVDPFALTEKEGWYYGRGTIDMKNGDAALLESLLRLKREHFYPRRDLVVAFTADEEAGGDANGPQYILAHHRSLIDAAMVVNLDGGGGATQNGKPLYFTLGTSEKTYLTYTLETTSPGGHGSLPGPDNAIYRLTSGLDRLAAFKFPVLLTATTRAYFSERAALERGAVANDMRAVGQDPPDLAAADRLSENVLSNALLRTTCVATLITGGHAENALPQRARATVQCRMMPGDTEANVRQLLSSTLADEKIQLTLDAPPVVSPESPPTPAILTRVAGIAHSMWPGVPIIPTMATGFSDDRQTRNAGIPSYDVSGVWMDTDENRAHGRDERIGQTAFDESVEFTYRLMRDMGSK